MQIDFHHGVTYILARLAGFDSESANTIAISSQYVDDAMYDGKISFPDGPDYYCIRSAHNDKNLKLDIITTTNEEYNEEIWVAFHFLPGNSGLSLSEANDIDPLAKLVCTPNSPVAQDMVQECIEHRNDTNALHRLGITMHVYADTWAHQGFAGIVKNELNDVNNIDAEMLNSLLRIGDEIFPPLGHLKAYHYPDHPFANWSYHKSDNSLVERKNLDIFLEAAENMFKVMQKFINPTASIRDFKSEDFDQLKLMLLETNSEDEHERHQAWLNNVTSGAFSFGIDQFPAYEKKYDFKNFDSYTSFIDSDWKKFHDALSDHRSFILETLIPKYQINFSPN
jgi:hypothetical protein